MIRLKQLRTENDVNQSDVAELLDVTRQAYSRYERGERELGYDMLCKLADFFGVSVDYLLGHNTLPVTASNSVNVFIEKYGELCSDKYFCAFAELHKVMTEAQKIFTLGMVVGYLREQGVSVSLNLP